MLWALFSFNGCVFNVKGCLADRVQFSGHQVKIMNLKMTLEIVISGKILN